MSERQTAISVCIILVIAIIVFLAATFFTSAYAWPGNQQWWDTTYTFDYARIVQNDGTVIEGAVESWLDWENSDAIQVKINGEVYYTHLSNVVLKAR